MVNSAVAWTEKKMEKENAWVTKIDRWMLSDTVRTIKNVLLQEANSAFTSCLYGRQGSSLTKVAAACGSLKLPRPQLVEELSHPTTIIDVNAVPAEETVGLPVDKLKIDKNSTGGKNCKLLLIQKRTFPQHKQTRKGLTQVGGCSGNSTTWLKED